MKPKLYAIVLMVVSSFYYQQTFSQANTALSNLVSPTAINQSLTPNSNNNLSLGSGTYNWKYLYMGTAYYLKNLRIIHAPGSTNFFTGPSAGNAGTTGTNNTSLGDNTLIFVSSGGFNTAVGFTALRGTTTGSRNTGIGYTALYNNTSGGFNVAIGDRALYVNSTGGMNVVNGATAMFFNTSGSGNSAYGNAALYSNTTGYSNVAVGVSALHSNKTGSGTVAIGDSALLKNDNVYHNVAVGSKALMNNTSGYYNVAVGYQSLYSNTASGYNTALGYQALYSNTGTAYDNTGTGHQALYYNTSGSRNTANGVWALLNNTTGSNNIANGVYAMQQNSTGNDNVAMGYYSLFANNGPSNIAIGSYALFRATSIRNAIAIGDSALYNTTATYAYNTGIGSKAMYANTIGVANTALGFNAMYSNTTGTNNTALGYNAMYASNSSSGYNTAVGAYAGYYTSTNGTFIGWDAYGMSAGSTNSTAIGYHAPTTASNQVRLGDGSVTSIGGAVGWSVISDGRFKKDIKEDVPGMEFINQLRPVTYNFDPTAYTAALRASSGRPDENKREQESPSDKAAADAKSKIVYTGFIAQEVEAAAKKIKYDFSGVDAPKNDKDYYGLRYGDFVVPIIKGMQQLSKKNDSLEEENAELKERLERIESILKISPNANQTLSGSSLAQNSPNPFRGNTVISYNVPQQGGLGTSQIVVYDAAGKALKQFNVSQGRGTVNLDASMLPSGTYNYSLFVDGKVVDTKKMVLIK
ncbi:MAG: tail fiber domain-containing protein [Agriterribacter sp.]